MLTNLIRDSWQPYFANNNFYIDQQNSYLLLKLLERDIKIIVHLPMYLENQVGV